MKKLGYVVWFDESGEGEIRCPSDKATYYVHWSAIKFGVQGAKTLDKHAPVEFELYENLYMKQVDKVEQLYFNYSTDEEIKIAQLMNDAWEEADTIVFDLADQYYKEQNK